MSKIYVSFMAGMFLISEKNYVDIAHRIFGQREEIVLIQNLKQKFMKLTLMPDIIIHCISRSLSLSLSIYIYIYIYIYINILRLIFLRYIYIYIYIS